MELVDTIKGPIARDQLVVTDIVEEGPNHRSIVTEWRFQGEIVKRDCHVILLRGEALFGDQAKM
jgi:hypothetical protein